MMERYYNQTSKNYYQGNRLEDAFPEDAYQVIYPTKLAWSNSRV